jgi:F-type H+-transporting ATP synthase subunit e
MTQVLRWSALATGLFYGAYTQLSISAREKAQAEQKAYSHKESLIRQAKQEWAKTHPQEQPKASSGGTLQPRYH